MIILNHLQIELIKSIAKSDLGKNYIWTGGTALAYRLRHRYSEDLDFFSNDPEASEIFLAKLKNLTDSLRFKQSIYEERQNRQLFLLTRKGQNIKLEFVFFPLKPLIKPGKDKELGIKIDSLLDIAVNKTLSAFQRQEVKDVFDLYLLCHTKNLELKKLVKLVEKKFGVKLDYISLLAKILATAKNLSVLEPLLIQKTKDWSGEVVNFFENKSRKQLKFLLF